MSGSHIAGNRNSTPEIGSSSLRPPSSRTAIGAGHGLRASGDIASLTQSTLAHRGIRPASEVYLSHLQNGNSEEVSRYAGEWLSEIEQQEVALEDMAAATLEPNFKDELGAIKQWFSVLSEAERTATLYILHQNTTEVQDRFFIRFLNEKCKAHPYSGVISPANFGEKDPMSQRLSDAMGKMNVGGSRNSIAGGMKRNSVLAPETIKAMFPDAVKAIESNKADFTQATGIAPSNRNSTVGERASMVAPSINAPDDAQKENASQQPPLSPWGPRSGNAPQSNADRPKSSSGHQPMGQFIQPPPSAGLRSPRPLTLSGDSNTATTTLNAPDQNAIPGGAAMLSPYAGSGNWASMVNTPMVPNFSAQQSANQADMVANATAMKLAALSTVNNRIQLDDVRKYRRARSSEGNGNNGPNGMQGNGVPNANFIMTNELGQVLTPQQAAALQAQQLAALNGRRSRPSSPGLAMQGGGAMGAFGVASPQNNGFLAAYDGVNPLANNLAGMSLNQFGLAVPGHEGYVSDHGEINRGRSPRGRRASSKAPEDPTNPDLLQDIPSWLRSLRLHKYTDNLKDLKWNELVELDDEALEKRGVNALGARRKMLKVFEQVKEAQTEGKV